tara:strand:- start:74 stop:331 length:258 start_codon:yes stop_codon:yes gene_type:complete
LKALTYKTKTAANELQEVLFDMCKDLFIAGTTKYSNVIKHPTKSLWAVPIVESGEYWNRIDSDLLFSIKSEIVELPSDWFPEIEI